MRIACFIIPYFGKLPDNFNIFLRTCSTNKDFDWLIITDDHSEYVWPENVHINYMEFSEFVAKVQSCFDFPITLHRPYKVCDFRGAFGEIFAKELENYRFWGHCDTDQYFGNISKFITDEILERFDKILCLGHFTLFRNIPEINQMYKIKDLQYNQDYHDVFSTMQHWIFDEWPIEKRTSLNRIFKQEKVNTYYNADCFCDLLPFRSCFIRTLFDPETETWVRDSVKNEIYIWENGNLLRCWISNGMLNKQDVLYVHIRQRKINCDKYAENKDMFSIFPNTFYSSDKLTDDDIIKLLRKSWLRGFFLPDEIGRKIHYLSGIIVLIAKKLKRMLKKQR